MDKRGRGAWRDQLHGNCKQQPTGACEGKNEGMGDDRVYLGASLRQDRALWPFGVRHKTTKWRNNEIDNMATILGISSGAATSLRCRNEIDRNKAEMLNTIAHPVVWKSSWLSPRQLAKPSSGLACVIIAALGCRRRGLCDKRCLPSHQMRRRHDAQGRPHDLWHSGCCRFSRCQRAPKSFSLFVSDSGRRSGVAPRPARRLFAWPANPARRGRGTRRNRFRPRHCR